MSLRYSTPDFQHPETGVPVAFIFDEDQKILTIELCEPLLDQWNMREEQSDLIMETELCCKRFGERFCEGIDEANAIIERRYADAWLDGVCFFSD